MYTLSQHQATMDAAEFIGRYRDAGRFLALCAQCTNFNQMWCCPSFDFDAESLTNGFNIVNVFGTTIEFDAETLEHGKSPRSAQVIADEAVGEVLKTLLPQMFSLEAEVPGSRSFTFRCTLCPQGCARSSGNPCRHPDKMRYSLEAVGFDVTAISHDLLGIDLEWSSDGSLPPRITLVTAVFRP